MLNNSSGENQSSNIQQNLLKDITGNVSTRDINQQNTSNIIIIQGNTPQTNRLRAPYCEAFKPLIENRLTLFGGRNTELKKIDQFINKVTGGYLVITAPAGFGKTSLMAKLVSEASETFAYHFFTPYENSNSVTEEGFLRNVVEQMALWHGCTDTLPEKLPDLQAVYESLLSEPLEHTHVLLIDGLDEVTNWQIARYLSRRLPDNLHIIVTVRDVAQDLALDYDFPKNQTEYLPLEGLTCDDVADVLRKAGKQATVFADNPTLLKEVMRISAYQEEPSLGADPFYVHLLAEDAADGRLTPAIATQPKGLNKYLSAWWRKIEESEEDNEPLEDLFGTLTVALGSIPRADLETINSSLVSKKKRNFFHKILEQVRRWIVGNEVKGYALVHPRLRDYICTEIYTDELLKDYREKLLTFCASWQEHCSFYALRYYAEHLRDAKRWEELYELAQNQAFADAQRQQLPDEPGLPLKTIQIALSSAAEEDNTGLMAEFLLLHARWIEQTKVQESPLEALRKGSLERALKFVEIYEYERQILWYLLLAWELKDISKLDEARAILKSLQQKDLPRYQMQNVYWQGNYAAYFIAHVFEVNDIICISLQEKILDDNYRRHFCKYLADLSKFTEAINTTLKIELDDIHKIYGLTYIAEVQAKKGDKRATATFDKALDITRKPFHKAWWVSEMIMIGKAQRDVGYLEAATVTCNEVREIVETITNASDKEYILNALENLETTLPSQRKMTSSAIDTDDIVSRESNQTDSFSEKNYQFDNFEECESELETTEAFLIEMKRLAETGNFADAFAIKEKIKDTLRLEDVVCQIALSLADKKQYDAAAEFAAIIQETDRRAKVQGQIAIAQVEASQNAASRTKFAINIQTAEESANLFLYARTLAYIANLQVNNQQQEAAIKNAYLAYDLVVKLNNLRHKIIILARIAEALANSGKKDEAKVIFDQAKRILEKTCAERGIVSDEDEDSLRAIALAEARIKDFPTARKTAKNIGFHWTAEVMQVIAKLQAADGQWEEALITISNALDNPLFFVQSQELNILCTKAVVEAVNDKKTAQGTFNELLEFARESGKQRDENLSTIAGALAEAGEISTALKIVDEIEDAFELVRALFAIAWEQLKKGEKVTTLVAALEAQNTIQDEKKLLQALKMIAQIQAIAGEGQQAVKTVETILTDRYWHLPGIASLFVETGDKVNFKRLLIPCAYYLDAAYEMCGYLAQLYPEQAEVVAIVVRA